MIEALLGMIETDYRAALRTIIGGANPQLSDDEARERVDRVVEYCPQDVGAARLRAWIDDDVLEAAMAVGDRLWLLSNSGEENPWFTAPALDRTRELPPAGAHRGDRGRCGLAPGADRGDRAARDRVRQSGRRNLGRLDQSLRARSRSASEFQAPTEARSQGVPGKARTITSSASRRSTSSKAASVVDDRPPAARSRAS